MIMEDYVRELWGRWKRGEARALRYQHWPAAQLAQCHENVAVYM